MNFQAGNHISDLNRGVEIRISEQGISVYKVVGQPVRKDGTPLSPRDMLTETTFVNGQLITRQGERAHHFIGGLPGVYFDEHGNQISREIARSAGFDVDADEKAKRRLEQLRLAEQMIDEEFSSAGPEEVIKEKAGYKIVTAGANLYNIKDPDNLLVNMRGPMAVETAEKLLDQLTEFADAEKVA